MREPRSNCVTEQSFRGSNGQNKSEYVVEMSKRERREPPKPDQNNVTTLAESLTLKVILNCRG